MRAVVVAIVLLMALAAIADASEVNRWEVSTFDNMATIIEQCYTDQDLDCIMDFVFSRGVPQPVLEDLRETLKKHVDEKHSMNVSVGPWWEDEAFSPEYLQPRRQENRMFVEPYFSPVDDFLFLNFPAECSPWSGNTRVCKEIFLMFWLANDRGALYLVLERQVPLPIDDKVADAFVMRWANGSIDFPDDIIDEIREFIPGHDDDYYQEALSNSILRLHNAGLVILCPIGYMDNYQIPGTDGCVSDTEELSAILAATTYLLEPTAENEWNTTHDLELTPEGEVDFEDADYRATLTKIDNLLDGKTPDG